VNPSVSAISPKLKEIQPLEREQDLAPAVLIPSPGTMESAVLKITITETPEELRWILQGRLAEPWVTEVKATWKEARRTREGRHWVVDLTNVTCVGKGGEELLQSMSNEGAQFIASGFYIKDVLEELKNCR